MLYVIVFSKCKEQSTEPKEGKFTDPYFLLWQSKNIHNYSYDQTIYSYGNYDKTRIQVRNDTINDIMNFRDSTSMAIKYWSQYCTIENWFQRIEDFKADTLCRIKCRYDTLYGYPCSVTTDYIYGTDLGNLYILTNLIIKNP